MKRHQLLSTAAVCAFSALSTIHPAHASGYPERPIRIVVPFEPGGPTDLLVRAIAPILKDKLGQSIVVENRGGAGGLIGAGVAARADGDGYTLLAGGSPTVQAPHFVATKPFNTRKDFTAVAPLAVTPYYLVVNSKLPANTVAELIKMAKDKPGTVTYASSGVGNGPHLAGLQMESLTGTSMVHVPYKGTAPATNDLVADRVTMMFGSMANLRSHIQSGSLKALAVATLERDPDMPNVPTLAEAGIPNFYPSVWYGLLAPSGMSEDAKKKINDAVLVALKDPQVIQLYAKFGAIPYLDNVENFQKFYETDIQLWDDFFKARPELAKAPS